MKKLLNLILGIAVLATLGGLAATPTPTPTSNAKGVNAVNVKLARTALPNPTPTPPAELAVSDEGASGTKGGKKTQRVNPSPSVFTGKVSQVDPKTRTFTLQAKGKEYRFTFQKIEMELPKVGAIVDVTYTGALGGSEPAKAIKLNSLKSN